MMTVSLIGCSNKKNEAVATVNGETITLGNYEKLLALNKLSMEMIQEKPVSQIQVNPYEFIERESVR